MGGTATTRLATALVIAVKRFGKEKENNIHISLPLTHQDLADLTGLTRETVSRQMSDFKKRHIESYDDASITVPSLSKLEALLV